MGDVPNIRTRKETQILDGLVKSRNIHNFVIPVKTGIQSFQVLGRFIDSRLRGNDRLFTNAQNLTDA